MGEGRGREAGLAPDKELPPAVKDPLVSAPALEEGEGTNPQGGFPGQVAPQSTDRLQKSTGQRRPGAPPTEEAWPVASFPGPPPLAPPLPGIFGTFLSCSNFPAPSPARPIPAQPSSGSRPPPDLARHTRTGGWRRSDPPPNLDPLSPRTLVLIGLFLPPHSTPPPPPGGRLKLWEREPGRSHQTELGLAQRHGELLRPRSGWHH